MDSAHIHACWVSCKLRGGASVRTLESKFVWWHCKRVATFAPSNSTVTMEGNFASVIDGEMYTHS